MNDPLCLVTGKPMRRGVRPMKISFEGRTTKFEMPGWYCDSDESIHSGIDMEVSDRALKTLMSSG